MSNFKTILNQFSKTTFNLKVSILRALSGANTFLTRKRTPEPDFLFLQTSELSFHKF